MNQLLICCQFMGTRFLFLIQKDIGVLNWSILKEALTLLFRQVGKGWWWGYFYISNPLFYLKPSHYY